MGKKVKKGKNRLDTFYQRAKEAGYRARSAYKLIQLNQKFSFLEKSRVCIDLCAAPGSWMQVAQKHMPVSSIIIGVDLVPIKPIPHTISFQGDITAERTRQELRGQLKTWKADVVLHDGAPNVGQNWLHDAYQQNLLTLQAFKLACEFLRKGGVFVSKVFRSKDYFSLEYVFRKLFKKVEATKPQASRYESAEIFVVCEGFQAPDKIDPQFFDARSVFQDIDNENAEKSNILKPSKKKRKPLGYEEGQNILFKRIPVSSFVKSKNFIEVLQEANEFEFDDLTIKEHSSTTLEIVECCKDLKLLGRRELRLLLNWRKNLAEELEKKDNEAKEGESASVEEETEPLDSEEEEELELKKVQDQVSQIELEKARAEKQKSRRVAKTKRKLDERIRLQHTAAGDNGPRDNTGDGLFNLRSLNKVQDLDSVVDQDADVLLEDANGIALDDVEGNDKLPRYLRYSKDETLLDRSGRYYRGEKESDSKRKRKGEQSDSSDDEDDIGGLNFKKDTPNTLPISNEDDEEESDGDETNPLITDLVGDNKKSAKERKAETWFNKDIFKDIETEADEDFELDVAINSHVEKGGVMFDTKKSTTDDKIDEDHEMAPSKKRSREEEGDGDEKSDDSDSDDSDDDSLEGAPPKPQMIGGEFGNGISSSDRTAGGRPLKRKKKDSLDAVGLALATEYIQTKKSRRDIIDAAWNRYAFGDEEDMPDWFERDESKNNNPSVVVNREYLKMYQDRLKDMNARTIKKVVEAKARKKRRVKKRMSRARKKSEVITANEEMSEREKAVEVKKLYKKAMAPVMKKKEKKYVVMKKFHGGRKPGATKGPYRMVDKRMRKDKRSGGASKDQKGKKAGGQSSKKR